MATLEEIKISFAARFAGNDAVPQPTPLRFSSAVSTVSYQSGRKTWQTSETSRDAAIIAGMVGPTGRKLTICGEPPGLDGDSIFEIGSITKVFTSLLLNDMVQRKEVALTDPVSAYLPTSVKVPERNSRHIRLVDLATHTSGLQSMPSNFKPRDQQNPYADYTVEQLYEFLGSFVLERDIGSVFEYSNLGVGLLGHALGLRLGADCLDLVRDRIIGPMGIFDMTATLSPAMNARLVRGYDLQLEPAANWDNPTLGAAGALRSTANDLLTLLEASLDYRKPSLASAIDAMLDVRRPTDRPDVDIALAWFVTKRGDRTIVSHGGGTGGYRSFIGFDRRVGVGVVVLANVCAANVDAIGMHLLSDESR